ncbi:MAG: VTT domain-containing protein [Verrucomicrobiales bacterium]|nr:VTT domain-containing protein [Verrucomicrobiales bacterium]
MPPVENPVPKRAASRETKRLFGLALIVAVVVALLHFTPLKQFAVDLQKWKEFIDQFGWKAHLAFVASSIIAISLGVPRLMLALGAGTLFGFVEGFSVAMASGLIGSYIAFFTARKGTSERLLEKFKGQDRIRRLLEKHSILNIFFVRQLPIPALAVNLLLGLVKTPHRKFLLGTFLGHLPSTGIVAAMGSAMGKDDISLALIQVSWGMAGLAVISFILILVRKKLEKDQA